MLPRHYLPVSLFIIGPACLSRLAGRDVIDDVAFGFLCALLPWALLDIVEHRASRRGTEPSTLGMLVVIVAFGVCLLSVWLNVLGVL